MRTILPLLVFASLAAAGDDFDFDLYRRLAARDGNLFFSGYSIRTALAMTAAGARGKTAEEMAAVLGLADDEAARAKALRAKLRGSEEFELATANAIWPQAGFALEQPFVDSLRENWGAAVLAVDYRGATEAARVRINTWVEERTKERIRDLIQPGILDADTRLVLTNAIYFKAPWIQPFSERATAPAPFHLADGSAVDVPTMQVVSQFRCARTGGATVVELPYRGGASMVIAMPDSMDDFALDGKTASAMQAALRGEMLRVHLPKFKATFTFDAVETLQAMGMKAPFSAAADFSGITTEDKLAISNVIHKAFVAVDEKGTEAAAATAVVMKRGAAAAPEEPRDVRIDRPFLFWIGHRPTGTVLFLGRIVDPR